MSTITAQGAVENWQDHLGQFFDGIKSIAESTTWVATDQKREIEEDPFGLGAPVPYEAPVLILRRPDPQSGEEQRVTFEPRHRFAVGAAGRIDVYAYPTFREAMLLRIPDTSNAEKLTWDEAENRVANAKWKAFSQERLPLNVDLANEHSVLEFLENLVARPQ